MSERTYIIVFPGSDESRISVVDITGTEYEHSHYDLASVKEFGSRDECVAYARHLAKTYGVTLIGERPVPLDLRPAPLRGEW